MKTNRGIIGTIVVIVVALIVLGFFGVSFKSIISSPVVRDNLKYAWNLFVDGIKWVIDNLWILIVDIKNAIQGS